MLCLSKCAYVLSLAPIAEVVILCFSQLASYSQSSVWLRLRCDCSEPGQQAAADLFAAYCVGSIRRLTFDLKDKKETTRTHLQLTQLKLYG